MAAGEGLVLALDGSLRERPLALLARSGRLLEGTLNTSVGLQEQLQGLLEGHRQELVRVLCSRGPGSYIGVRSALAAALGVARGLRLPLGLLGSLELVVATVDPPGGSVLALADAGRGGSYGQLFRATEAGDGGAWLALGPAHHLDREAKWPPEWASVDAMVGSPGEGRQLPQGARVLEPRRERAAALALASRGVGEAISDYDLVSADYPEATGVR